MGREVLQRSPLAVPAPAELLPGSSIPQPRDSQRRLISRKPDADTCQLLRDNRRFALAAPGLFGRNSSLSILIFLHLSLFSKPSSCRLNPPRPGSAGESGLVSVSSWTLIPPLQLLRSAGAALFFPPAAPGLPAKEIRQLSPSRTPASPHSTSQMQTSSQGNFEGRKESHRLTPQLRRESPSCGSLPPCRWHHHLGRGEGTPAPPGPAAVAIEATWLLWSMAEGRSAITSMFSAGDFVTQGCASAAALGYLQWAEAMASLAETGEGRTGSPNGYN